LGEERVQGDPRGPGGPPYFALLYDKLVNLYGADFGTDLFRVSDRALEGVALEITHKDSTLKPTAPEQSKLARAVRRHALLVAPQSIVESDAGLMSDLEKTWKWDDESL
jgi:hypothetical protein